MDDKQIEYKIDYKENKRSSGFFVYLATTFFTFGILALFATAFMEMYYNRCTNQNVKINCTSGLCSLVTSDTVKSIATSNLDLTQFFSNIDDAASKYNLSAIFINARDLIYLRQTFEGISKYLQKSGVAVVATNVSPFGNCGQESTENVTELVLELVPFLDGVVISHSSNAACTKSEKPPSVAYISKLIANHSVKLGNGKFKSPKIFVETLIGLVEGSSSSYQPDLKIYSELNITGFVHYVRKPEEINFDVRFDSSWGTPLILPDLFKVGDQFGDYRDYFNLRFYGSILPNIGSVLDNDENVMIGLNTYKRVSELYKTHNFTKFSFLRKNNNIMMSGSDVEKRTTLNFCYPTKTDGCQQILTTYATEGKDIGMFNRENVTVPMSYSSDDLKQRDILKYDAIFCLIPLHSVNPAPKLAV